mgnify:CR=1 FL=1
MKVSRRFTKAGADPYENIEFVERSSEIRNPDGSLVFAMDGVRAPRRWSQVAVDVLVQKYFRKAGVPAATRLSRRLVPSELRLRLFRGDRHLLADQLLDRP